MRSAEVLAVCCSDLHLSPKPPILWDATAEVWYEAMSFALVQVKAFAETHRCPVICAGDVFDRPDPPVELVNFAIRHLPKMYAVYGQHDIHWHQAASLDKTAYWTLVEAGKVVDLPPGKTITCGRLRLHGFPWGSELEPLDSIDKSGFAGSLDIAVVHTLVWQSEKPYPAAPPSGHVREVASKLAGFDLIVSGDNHQHFLARNGTICNCGCLMRRKANEIGYQPRIGIITTDGSFASKRLDVSRDRFIARGGQMGCDPVQPLVFDIPEDEGHDFQQHVRAWLSVNSLDAKVKQVILEALQEAQK